VSNAGYEGIEVDSSGVRTWGSRLSWLAAFVGALVITTIVLLVVSPLIVSLQTTLAPFASQSEERQYERAGTACREFAHAGEDYRNAYSFFDKNGMTGYVVFLAPDSSGACRSFETYGESLMSAHMARVDTYTPNLEPGEQIDGVTAGPFKPGQQVAIVFSTRGARWFEQSASGPGLPWVTGSLVPTTVMLCDEDRPVASLGYESGNVVAHCSHADGRTYTLTRQLNGSPA
jgi:hypothetical protein